MIYVFLQFYGWYCWTRQDASDGTLLVHSLPMPWIGGWVVVTVAGTIGLGWVMTQNWGFWICVDVVAIWVYLTKDLNATAVLYIAFLVMASFGLVMWSNRLAKQPSNVEMQ